MADPIIVPPLRKPVNLRLNPVPTASMFVEMLNRDDPAYVDNAPMKRGTLYSTIVGAKQEVVDQFPLLYFVQETQYQQSDQLVIWRWTTDPTAEDTFNAEISYALESVTSPTYVRTYTIRRDVYDNLTPIAQGTPLTGIIGVKILDGGQDYTYANGTIDTDGTVEFVINPDGVIISGIITSEGSGVVSGSQITITGDGAAAEATAIIQPATAVLIGQKKTEFPEDHPLQDEFVQVTRIYQTLPGPTIHSTQLHVDGVVVDVATTVKVASGITSGETLVGNTWTITTKTQEDNAYIGKEIVITRLVPGNQIPYTKLDDDGKVVTGTRILKDTTTITTTETLALGTWTHTYKEFLTTRLTIGEEASDLVSWEVSETRDIPGNPMPSSRLDEDGIKVGVVKTMESAATIAAITPRETLVTGTWTKIISEYISDLVSWKVVETRAIPGNALTEQTIDDRDGDIQTVTRIMSEAATITPVESILGGNTYHRVESKPITELVAWKITTDRPLPGAVLDEETVDDRDGAIQSVTRRLFDASTIVPSESIVGGVTYRKVEAKPITDILAWRIVTDRPVPGNNVVKTTIDADGDIVTETRTIVIGPPTLVTTITTAGGVYTKTFGEPINDLISWKVVQVKATQNALDTYSAEIPDLLPEEFRPEVPVTTHEETLIGVATAITLPLATGVLMESKAQIDYNVYKHTLRGRTSISLPQTITNKEITSEFGGGDVNRVLTLNLYNSLSLDEGLTVLSCNIRKIDDIANGLAVKTTRQLNAASWPELYGTHVDEKYGLQVDITRQTIDPLTVFPAPPTDLSTIVEYRPHDKWKTIQITSTIDLDNLGDLNTQYPGSMIHSFPPELVVSGTEPVINWAEATCDCADSFSSSLIANMNQYTGIVTTRITEDFVTDPNATFPVASVTQFFPEAHVFGFAFASVCGCGESAVLRAISPEFHIPLCLHDDFTLCVGGGVACAGAPYSWTFAATSPAVLPHGSYITLSSRIERWRFGVFHRVFTEVLVP